MSTDSTTSTNIWLLVLFVLGGAAVSYYFKYIHHSVLDKKRKNDSCEKGHSGR
jgi:hypothetical protein